MTVLHSHKNRPHVKDKSCETLPAVSDVLVHVGAAGLRGRKRANNIEHPHPRSTSICRRWEIIGFRCAPWMSVLLRGFMVALEVCIKKFLFPFARRRDLQVDAGTG